MNSNNNNNNNTNTRRQQRQRKTVTTTTTTAPAARPRRRRNKRRRNTTGLQANVALSGCAKDYLRSLSNPFQAISPLPCIPDVIALPSQKVRTYYRGNFVSSTQEDVPGTGFVMVNPLMTLFNNQLSIFLSLNNYGSLTTISTGTSVAPTAGTIGVAMQSPFSSNVATVINGRQQFRLVSCGIRVQYAGTLLNRGGLMNLWRSVGNQYSNAINYTDVTTALTTGITAVDKKWHVVNFVPDDPKYFAYQTYDELRAMTGQVGDPFPYNFALGVLISNSVPTSSYAVEVVAHWEVIGQGIQSQSASHSDPTGMGAVLSSIPTRNPIDTAQSNEQGLLLRTLSSLSNNFSGMLPTAVQTAATVYDLYKNRGKGIMANSMQLASAPLIEDAD